MVIGNGDDANGDNKGSSNGMHDWALAKPGRIVTFVDLDNDDGGGEGDI